MVTWSIIGILSFMFGRCCVDQLFTLLMIINKFLSKQVKLFCAFIDLKKAYDSVLREP